MDYVLILIIRTALTLIICAVAAWVFTMTGFGWEFWEYFALAIGISIASTNLDAS